MPNNKDGSVIINMSESQKTYSPSAKEIDRQWFVVDAGDKVLGRLATEIARILRGKHKPV